MPDENNFKVADYNRIIDDIIDEFFDQHDLNFDYKELLKANILGSPEEIPEGMHVMPDGSLMPDSEMSGFEGG